MLGGIVVELEELLVAFVQYVALDASTTLQHSQLPQNVQIRSPR